MRVLFTISCYCFNGEFTCFHQGGEGNWIPDCTFDEADVAYVSVFGEEGYVWKDKII